MPAPGDHIFACISQYQMPLAEVDKHLPAHIAWLKAQDEAGRIVATGRQKSGLGGVSILAAASEAEMREILATDPFQIHGCSAYWLFEFELNAGDSRGQLMDHFFAAAAG